MKSVLAAAVAMALVAGGGVAAAPTASAAPACPAVTFVGVRGSGEHKGLGSAVDAVLRRFKADVASGGNPRLTVSTVTLEYPAVAVGYGGLNHYGANYVKSVTKGVAALKKTILDIQSGPCGIDDPDGSTDIVLVGYSQGAQVVGDTYAALTTKQKHGVFHLELIADPRFEGRSDGPGNVGDYDPKLNGIAHYLKVYSKRRVWGDLYPPIAQSICMAHDPVCNFTPGTLAFCKTHSARCPHTNYQRFKNPRTKHLYTDDAADSIYDDLVHPIF